MSTPIERLRSELALNGYPEKGNGFARDIASVCDEVQLLQARVDALEAEKVGLVGRNTWLIREIEALEGEGK